MPRILAGRYRLDAEVGRGGMGSVWSATDVVLGRPVAVKVVELTAAVEVTTAARFGQEVRAAARLSHPNVVTVHDAGADGPTLYLVMELLSGPSLSQVVADHGPLPIDVAVGYGAQICAGLGAAHTAGLVHRDLKPANVVVTADGLVKIVDFGIARVVADTAAGLTATATVVGTAAYVAPEQASGRPVDSRADLYALGCVLFALLTGQPPFRGDTPVQTLSLHIHAPPPDLIALRPDVPADLDATITALLAKDPEDRPPTAAVVAALLSGSTPGVPPPTIPAAAVTAVLPSTGHAVPVEDHRRRRVAAIVGAAAVTALVAVLLAGVAGSGSAGTPATTTDPRTATTVAPATAPTTPTAVTTTPPTTAPVTTPVTTAPAKGHGGSDGSGGQGGHGHSGHGD